MCEQSNTEIAYSSTTRQSELVFDVSSTLATQLQLSIQRHYRSAASIESILTYFPFTGIASPANKLPIPYVIFRYTVGHGLGLFLGRLGSGRIDSVRLGQAVG